MRTYTREMDPLYFFAIDHTLPHRIAAILVELFWSRFTVDSFFEMSNREMVRIMRDDAQLTVDDIYLVMHVVHAYRRILVSRMQRG